VNTQSAEGLVTIELSNTDACTCVASGQHEWRLRHFRLGGQFGLAGFAKFPLHDAASVLVDFEKTARGPEKAFSDLGFFAQSREKLPLSRRFGEPCELIA
jgi:hypothetical protein